MQVAITVNDSTSDQAPETTTEQTNSVQQTGGTEGLTAPSQPTTNSAANQQEVLNLLHSESAGAVHGGAPNQPTTIGDTALMLSAGVIIIAVIIVLAVLCQQMLEKLTEKPSVRTPTSKKPTTKKPASKKRKKQ